MLEAIDDNNKPMRWFQQGKSGRAALAWFRLYDDVLNDQKVQTLPAELFKLWINILCIASRNQGRLPTLPGLSYDLRRRSDWVQSQLEELVKRGLLDLEGDAAIPHNWFKRQYKSDSSSERVRKHRQQKRNVSPAVTVTPPESETESDITSINLSASRFDEFWSLYPKRKGSNPRSPAKAKFDSLVKSGVDPELIIGGLRSGASDMKPDTEFVPMATTWLNQRRWEQYKPLAAAQPTKEQFFVKEGSPQWEAWLKHSGRSYPCVNSGWWFPSEWPPGFPNQRQDNGEMNP